MLQHVQRAACGMGGRTNQSASSQTPGLSSLVEEQPSVIYDSGHPVSMIPPTAITKGAPDVHPPVSNISLEQVHSDVQKVSSQMDLIKHDMLAVSGTVRKLFDLHLEKAEGQQQDMDELKGAVGKLLDFHLENRKHLQQQAEDQRQGIAVMLQECFGKLESVHKELSEKRVEAKEEQEAVQVRIETLDENFAQQTADMDEKYRILAEDTLSQKVTESRVVSFTQEPQASIVPQKREMSKFQRSRSATSVGTLHGGSMPKHAFVINFRRLVKMDQFFNLNHELIKSTAIAAFTLVAADSPRQAGFTITFIILVFILYARHEAVYDGLDVEDVKNLVPLLVQDDDHCEGGNPNRLLKSLSLHSRRSMIWGGRLVYAVIIAASFVGWFSIRCWNILFELTDDTSHLDPFERFSLQVIGDENDAGVLAMQLIILDIMFALELIFEFMLWREMFLGMPSYRPASGSQSVQEGSESFAWDPRRGGVPWSYRLLGLPSMWFTTPEAMHKFKEYVVAAQLGAQESPFGIDVYPEEIARYALLGDNEREELSRALQQSKWVDGRAVGKADDAKTHDAKQTLGITLCFFDTRGVDEDCDFLGQPYDHPGQLQYF